jgi:hypothetical protein
VAANVVAAAWGGSTLDFAIIAGLRVSAGVVRTKGRPGRPGVFVGGSSMECGAHLRLDPSSRPDDARPQRRLRVFIAYFLCPDTVRRGIRVALVVGPILGLINHFDLLAGGELTRVRLLKISLTFLVPFCVSSFSSATTMMAGTTSLQRAADRGK